MLFLGTVHRPSFYLKRDVSETGFCLSRHVEPSHLRPEARASPRSGDRLALSVGPN
jgi:hypothetical protein